MQAKNNVAKFHFSLHLTNKQKKGQLVSFDIENTFNFNRFKYAECLAQGIIRFYFNCTVCYSLIEHISFDYKNFSVVKKNCYDICTPKIISNKSVFIVTLPISTLVKIFNGILVELHK